MTDHHLPLGHLICHHMNKLITQHILLAYKNSKKHWLELRISCTLCKFLDKAATSHLNGTEEEVLATLFIALPEMRLRSPLVCLVDEYEAVQLICRSHPARRKDVLLKIQDVELFYTHLPCRGTRGNQIIVPKGPNVQYHVLHSLIMKPDIDLTAGLTPLAFVSRSRHLYVPELELLQPARH